METYKKYNSMKGENYKITDCNYVVYVYEVFKFYYSLL